MPTTRVRAQLDKYYQEVASIILTRQNPATGLIPASVAITTHGDYRDAWVRDNVYTIFCVWGLALAYRRIDDADGRGYELEHATIKTMRGLLSSMMRQAHKVEKFKNTQAAGNALHAKYNTQTGGTVVGDTEWGHLQIDATSIFLLALSQMTASGMKLIYTMDEVHFVQNLVFYIERAYRTPDFGVWERGNKVNHGEPELNSSSIGMVVAALQAINGINLFGARGGPASVIHVLPDEMTRNYTTLHSALPRESASKEIDAALLSVISFPAFAVHDPALVTRTRNDIVKKLGGNYGFKRFLRDGHQTVLENVSRLHYDPAELKIFEGVESEWPLFYTYMILDGLFREDHAQVDEYRRKLDPLLVDSAGIPNYNRDHLAHESHSSPLARSSSVSKRSLPPAHMRLVPELFIVPRNAVEEERKNPGSQQRVPNENVPLVWAQSLYILGNLIYDDLLSTAELDPLGRRLGAYQRKAHSEVVVQVVLLAEDEELQDRLRKYGLDTQIAENCAPITISPPSALRDAYTALGENQKLGLTGRPKRPIGTLSTSKLYRCQGRLYAFTPHFMDKEEFYLVSDNDYLVSLFEQELSFVRNHWFSTGRPTMTVMLTREMLGGLRGADIGSQKWRSSSAHSSGRNLLNFMMSLRSGNVGGVRVRCGRLGDMINTACISSLDFLVSTENSDYEDWDTLLKGEEADQDLSKLSYSPRDTEETSKERIRSASTDRRRTRRRSSMDIVVPKSPLASPWFSDEPWAAKETFKLQDHVESHSGKEAPHRGAGVNYEDGASLRIQSPVRGLATNLFETTPEGSLELLAACEKEAVGSSNDGSAALLTLTLADPKRVHEAIKLLGSSSNLYDQVDLLHYIQSCEGLEYQVAELGTVAALLEEVYLKAMHLRQWSIVRQAAGLLKKMVNSLTINVADLLIRQRPVTVGFGSEEMFITSPMHPGALQDLIYTHCASDVREAPLVQEILTYLGSFIRGTPSFFEGIMRVRTHFFIIAMREEISRMKGCNEEEAVEQLMQLSPFEMKSLLGQILAAHDSCNMLPPSAAPGVVTAAGSHLPPLRWHRLGHVQVQPGTTTDHASSSAMRLSNIGANLPTELVIRVQSAGFTAGCFTKMEIVRDGAHQPIRGVFGRGLNVAVLDPLDGTIVERASYDTHISRDESDEFAKLIDLLEPGTLVVVAAMDDAAEHLTEQALAACERLGSTAVRNMRYRDSWCIIGEKGAERGSVTEAHRPAHSGPTDFLERRIDLGLRRRSILNQSTATTTTTTTAPSTDASASTNNQQQLTLLLPSQGRWLRRRKNDGALNRVPRDFYPKVHAVLSRTEAILVGSKSYLPSNPTVYEKTPEELNFALQVEQLLDVIRDPAERQVAAETLMLVYRINQRNPEIRLKKGRLDLLAIIRDAIMAFWTLWTADHAAAAQSPRTPDHHHHPAPEPTPAPSDHHPADPNPPPPFLHRVAIIARSHSQLNIDTGTPTSPHATTDTAAASTTTAANTTTTTPMDWAFERHERVARRVFFDLPQEGPQGTMAFLAQSCVRLMFDVAIGLDF
ncbi:hypothetical protein PhCBS80983_g04610 [Powellomyces hirtus]|uniref:Phosphorylase kinase alphabeta n=1 Tax=Powellomyces hirtus TaxID=109895 RepID=A0A507DZT5_9FUNG|nr:hypothetical protein PhCBS80983_g04610 [Powellomyces hirtus]